MLCASGKVETLSGGIGMKLLLPAFVMLISLLSGVTLAQVDTDPDEIGLYVSGAAMVNRAFVQPGDPYEVYLVATNVTTTYDIAAFEFSLSCPQPNVSFLTMNLHHGDQVTGTFPDIKVVLTTPRENSSAIVLACIRILVSNTYPTNLLIGPYSGEEGGSLGNYLPGYVDTNSDTVYPLYPSSGSIYSSVFGVNTLAPVAVTSATLDKVKALYR